MGGGASCDKVISCSIRTSKLGTAGHATLQTFYCKISNSAGEKSTRGRRRHKEGGKGKVLEMGVAPEWNMWRTKKQTENIHPPESVLACMCVNEQASVCALPATAAVSVFLEQREPGPETWRQTRPCATVP